MKGKKFIAILSGFITAFSGSAFPAQAADAADVNYARALQHALYLYDANMCGNDVSETSLLNWRENCHIGDAKMALDTKHTDLSADFIAQYSSVLDSDQDGKIDVSGGYHDAGDFVKFGLPQAFTAATLQWELYEYRDAFEQTGQLSHMQTVVGQFTEYLKNCTYLDENGDVIAYCYQVGDGATDHDYWGAPEVQTTFRMAYFATKDNPATDIVALAAASLAADYANTENKESLQYAKALYRFVSENPIKQVGDDHAPDGEEYYQPTAYEDELAMAAAWLYLATEEEQYLTQADQYLGDGRYDAPYWMYCWDDTWLGSIAILAETTNDAEYWDIIKETLDIWQTDYNTPQGYACIDEWGSARYNTNAQFFALLYAKHTGETQYADWAKDQMAYLMGDNDTNTCYVVGFSEHSVKYPHHAAATGLNDCIDNVAHQYVLYGALVGGPGFRDNHNDATSDYQFNEVSIDYNAGFVGACAGLYTAYGAALGQQPDDAMPYQREITILENGDVNGDGSITLTDVVLLQKFLLAEIQLEEETQYNRADLDRNNKINGFDLAWLKRLLTRQ